MPLTPFHLGPALFFGLLLFQIIHLPTFVVANVILDIEPFMILLFAPGYALHGFFHSFLGGLIVAIILSLVMIKMDGKVQKIMSFFKLEQKHSKKSIWLASFFGIYLHILLDAPVHTDIKPFFPSTANPFYNSQISLGSEVGFCLILLIIGVGLYFYKVQRQ